MANCFAMHTYGTAYLPTYREGSLETCEGRSQMPMPLPLQVIDDRRQAQQVT